MIESDRNVLGIQGHHSNAPIKRTEWVTAWYVFGSCLDSGLPYMEVGAGLQTCEMGAHGKPFMDTRSKETLGFQAHSMLDSIIIPVQVFVMDSCL